MKYIILKYFSLFALFVLIIGCFDEGRLVEISIPAKELRLVIHSVISPPGALERIIPLGVTVSSSAQIFDMSAELISDAQVLLYKNEQFFGTMEYVDSLGFYPINDIPDYKDNYRIEVKKEGFIMANAIVSVPTAIEIDTVIITPFAFFDEEDYVFSEVEIRFQDDPNETNFYEVVIFVTSGFYNSATGHRLEDFQENAGIPIELVAFDKIITEEPYYTSFANLDSNYPKSLLFRDNTFNGREYSLKVYFNPPGSLHIPGHVANQRLRVYLRKITKERFHFKTTIIQQYIQRQEDLLYGVGEPINVFSNIENGYGLFGAYSYDSALLTVEGFVAKKD